MPDEPNNGEPRARGPTDLVGELVRAAGRRPEPPTAAYERTLGVATAALAAKLARRRRREWTLRIAAALLAAVAAVAIWSNRPVAPALPVARLERAIGAIDLAPSRTAAWTVLRADGASITAGSRLRSRAHSKAGLLLAGGTSLRLAADTEIEIEAVDSIVLRGGTVYVDTDGGSGLVIVTARATARDVGTQFEVTTQGDELRLRVRDGRVRLSSGEMATEGRAGEVIEITGSGPWQRGRMAANDPHWQWVEAVAPAPEIDGKPLRVLLDWVARETGRPLRFASPGVEQLAAATRLHGTVRHMAPMDALSATLATTDLGFSLLADGTILIDSRVADAAGP